MRTILVPLIQTLRVTFHSRAALHLEILVLRQQLAILHHNRPKRPHLRPVDRFFWACLSKLWPGWRNPLIIVKPDTVIGWSRKDRSGRPTVPKEIRDLIRRISLANVTWERPAWTADH